ncbi:unnamed protein product, partial [Tetraodon nigroviridis]
CRCRGTCWRCTAAAELWPRPPSPLATAVRPTCTPSRGS